MIVYKTINLITRKIYIGKSVKENKNYFGSGKIIKKAIKKYGIKNFKKEILEYCSSQKELNEKEIYWIKKLNSKIPNGYNILSGGTGEDFFLHLSEKQKQKHLKKIRNGWNKIKQINEVCETCIYNCKQSNKVEIINCPQYMEIDNQGDLMIKDLSLNEVENIILDNTKWMDFVLEETRKRNTVLQEELKNSYGKKIGLGTPYEELINKARQVKTEFDKYLKIIRNEFKERLKKEQMFIKKSQKGKRFKPRPTT